MSQMSEEQTIIELCEPTKFKRLVLGKDAVLISNGHRVDIDELDLSQSESCAAISEVDDFRRYIRKVDFDREMLTEDLRKCLGALEFYSDKDNWDDDQFIPTVWDNGNIDMGRRARECLASLTTKVGGGR